MSARRRTTLLLDLDGTLVDPAPGIIGSCRYAMEQMGCPVADDADLRWIIGPSLRITFGRLLDGQGDPEQAIEHYRARYGQWGLTAADLYDGIHDVLQARREAGDRLLICTAKPAVFARLVVEHFGLTSLLDGVYGPDLDGRFDDKGDLIAHILETENLVSHDLCMIGDREHDVKAARRHGIPAIGVLWGYGSRDELIAAGAARIVSAPDALLADIHL